MKLHHVRHFLAIAEHGSLHRAAVHLGAAQSALSRSLAELEASLGTVLVERSRNGSLLTPAGHRFVTRARAIEEEMRRAMEEARQHAGIKAGTVTVGMSPTGQMLLLPRTLNRFYEAWPEVTLSIHDAMAEDCEAGLVEGRLDFFAGACPHRPLDPRLRHGPLCGVERIVLARPGSRWQGQSTLRSLSEAPWIAVRANGQTQADHDAVFEALGLAVPRPVGIASSMLTVWLLLRAVDALVIVPRAWWDETPTSGVFTKIEVEETLGAVDLCTVRRATLPLTPAAQYFYDLITGLQPRS